MISNKKIKEISYNEFILFYFNNFILFIFFNKLILFIITFINIIHITQF